MSDDKTPKIPKLIGSSNYRLWAEEVKSYLEARGLLDLVLGIERRPGESRNTRSSAAASASTSSNPQEPVSVTTDGNTETLTVSELWRRKNARAKTIIMGYCNPTMKNKIIDLPTAQEQWEVLKNDCRPSDDTSMSTYLDRFHCYEPQKGATIDSISNDLRDLQSAMVATDKTEAPSDKAKIRALLRAVRKLDSRFETRIEILQDKTSKLDYDSIVASLKEAEQRIRKSEDEEKALATIEKSRKKGNGLKHKQNQRKRKGECWCCGEEGHVKTECSIWLKTIDGKAFAKKKKRASTGPLPTPGVNKRARIDDDIEADEEARVAIELSNEIPTELCWGALTDNFKREVTWVIDSGATRHMTFARDAFSEFIQLKTPRTVRTANGEIIYGTGIGNVPIHVFLDDFEIKKLILKDVLYVPNLAGSLISVSKLQDYGILT